MTSLKWRPVLGSSFESKSCDCGRAGGRASGRISTRPILSSPHLEVGKTPSRIVIGTWPVQQFRSTSPSPSPFNNHAPLGSSKFLIWAISHIWWIILLGKFWITTHIFIQWRGKRKKGFIFNVLWRWVKIFTSHAPNLLGIHKSFFDTIISRNEWSSGHPGEWAVLILQNSPILFSGLQWTNAHNRPRE